MEPGSLCFKANQNRVINNAMESLVKILHNHPVFACLDEATCQRLASHAIRREMKKGETLAMQGDVWAYLFLVVSGEVDALKVSPEGRNLLVTTFPAGELFWGLALFQPDASLLATLEASEPSVVYLWPKEVIEPLFIEHGQMAWELCRIMIQRMQRASTIVEELAFQPVSSRLARLLLDDFANTGGTAITRRMTLDEMAARVGTTREMVCRALYRFAGKKMIDITRTEFTLTDRDGLQKMASGSDR
jgi:CRP-like cAMP-binding protein